MEVIFSIILIWITVVTVLQKRNLYFFLPFIIIGIAYSFEGAFVFYELFNHRTSWLFLEMTSSILLLWLFVNLWRKNGT